MTTFADGALKLEIDGERATLTLDRPQRRNAFNEAMWLALPQICAAVDADASVKILIVRGAAGHFAAGADIAEFETVYATRQRSDVYAAAAHDGVAALARMAKPSLAMIEGFCIGGGMALALACDIRLAASTSSLGITPAKLGLVYNLFDTKRLVDAVGASAARDILFTGRIMPAAEGLAIGLVDFVHEPADLATAVEAKAAAICANSQWSIRQAKLMIARVLDGGVDDGTQTRDVFLDAVAGPDFLEGRASFMAKRPPAFPYR